MSHLVTSSLYKTLFDKSNGKKYMVGGGIGINNGIGLGTSNKFGGTKFLKLLDDKKGFLIMVFSNLLVQLGITYYIMMNYNTMIGNKSLSSIQYYLLFFVQLALILILALVPMPSWLKFILFSLFSSSDSNFLLTKLAKLFFFESSKLV